MTFEKLTGVYRLLKCEKFPGYYSVDEIRELQILVVEMKKELRELKGGA
ncbi:hypothetical protein [Methanobacterium formicicum]|jgi:hypothetical protein|uniref:Uncharacterized protein n=1 Tax=Methanobacterium formicicum TaxID=2162 RepID=A0A0S4FMV5_METFO|nr:hypothetical protein [Methanobacterium formicicum]CEL24389.1 hypothetical protein MB9_0746 [Methanobacterium formicicum]